MAASTMTLLIAFSSMSSPLPLRLRAFASFLLQRVGELAGHFAGDGALLLRVGEHAEPLEFRFADEPEQGLETLLRLAGKPHDEGGAQREAGKARAEAGDQVAQVS